MGDEGRVSNGLGIDRNLIRAGVQKRTYVIGCPHTAAHGERHEALLRGTSNDIVERIAPLVACGYIKKTQFVGAFGIIDPCLLDRVAGVDQIDEVDTFDDPSASDIEAGNDTRFQHGDIKRQ